MLVFLNGYLGSTNNDREQQLHMLLNSAKQCPISSQPLMHACLILDSGITDNVYKVVYKSVNPKNWYGQTYISHM